MAVVKVRNQFLSSNKQTNIIYTKWFDDENKPKTILLIAHGMAEHIDRYDDFARYLVRHGYAVYGNDHLGHGKTVSNAGDLGYFDEKDGRYFVVDDMKSLCFIARAEYPGIPVILLGHSMGSLIARLFCMKYSNDIDAAIFMGTSGKNPATKAGIFLVNVISLLKGEHYASTFIDNMAFGGNNKKVETPASKFDWLSHDKSVVQLYLDDEKCGYLFTLSGMRELFQMLGETTKKGWADHIRKELPILVISGSEDPVGNYGKGVQETFETLRGAGIENLAILLYDGMRHEVLNEIGKENVYEDILGWCDSVMDD